MGPAEDQLRTLISYCKDEKIQLQKHIDDSLADGEYLMAHYHSEALYQLDRRLNALNNLSDKFYEQKESAKRRIANSLRLIETEDSDFMMDYYKETMERAKAELETLNQIPTEEPLYFNETFLDQTLDKLLAGKIKNLKVILKKKDNFFLSFVYSKRLLKVTLPDVKQHAKNWLLGDENMIYLKNLGFKSNVNETKLTLELTGNRDVILGRLKVILSKIVFEIYYYNEFKNESYIEYKVREKQ